MADEVDEQSAHLGLWVVFFVFAQRQRLWLEPTQWLWTYNNDRPNMGIGGITPAMKLKMAA